MEQELAAGLGERQIAEFVQDDEVHSCEVFREPALASIAGLGLEPVDQIDDIVEPAAGAGADAASDDGDREVGLAGAGRPSALRPPPTISCDYPSCSRRSSDGERLPHSPRPSLADARSPRKNPWDDDFLDLVETARHDPGFLRDSD